MKTNGSCSFFYRPNFHIFKSPIKNQVIVSNQSILDFKALSLDSFEVLPRLILLILLIRILIIWKDYLLYL